MYKLTNEMECIRLNNARGGVVISNFCLNNAQLLCEYSTVIVLRLFRAIYNGDLRASI